MRFYANSDTGQFGPFWWINGIHHAHDVTNWCRAARWRRYGSSGPMGDLGRRQAWQQGGCGLELFGRFWSISRTKWHIIEALN